jgi:hypothetical protein
MKFSKRVIRIRRKYVSIASIVLFLSLGLVVTFILNNQISEQKQNYLSKAESICEEWEEREGGSQCLKWKEQPSSPSECKQWQEKEGETICIDWSESPHESPKPPPDEIEEGGGCAGTCINVNTQSCSIATEIDLCPGASNIQCCKGYIRDDGADPPPNENNGSGDDQHIGKYCSTPKGTGSCQYSSGCSGQRVAGYCPGSSAVQCCIEDGGSNPDSGEPPLGGPGPDDPPIQKPPPPPPAADDPKGVIDQNDGHTIRGWAFDPNDTNESIQIHIYIYPSDGTTEGYNTGPTSVIRPDVNEAYGIAGVHGFDFNVPSKWCDGGSYTADVFAINIGEGGNTTLGGSIWSCTGGGLNPDGGQKPNDIAERDSLLKKNFDGRWYLSEYTDVRKDKGYGKNSETAFSHYIAHGMSEKRNPNPNFDEKYYLDKNPDVVGGISRGEFRSGFEHYLIFGQKQPECRKPKSDTNAPAPCGNQLESDSQSDSKADISLTLDGIGPGANIKNPVRTADIKIISGEKTIKSASDFLTYEKASGNFINPEFNLGSIPAGLTCWLSKWMVILIRCFWVQMAASNLIWKKEM